MGCDNVLCGTLPSTYYSSGMSFPGWGLHGYGAGRFIHISAQWDILRYGSFAYVLPPTGLIRDRFVIRSLVGGEIYKYNYFFRRERESAARHVAPGTHMNHRLPGYPFMSSTRVTGYMGTRVHGYQYPAGITGDHS